jgi:hypothetical protein
MEGVMIRASVMYPAVEGKTFDHAYYANKPMALVKERLGQLGLVRCEVDKGLAGGAPGAMKAHGRELMADVPNFTNIQPQGQISEIMA